MLIAGLGFPIPFWLLHKKFGFDRVFTPILVTELGYLSVGINSSVFSILRNVLRGLGSTILEDMF
ncbi:oligopeptide transporter [Moniliophthora roreri]|nr:oligopeptide transporter [Moniliophthora roreri]